MKKVVFSIAMMTIALMSCNKDDESLITKSHNSDKKSITENREGSVGDNNVTALPQVGSYEVSSAYGVPVYVSDGEFSLSECEGGHGICGGSVNAGAPGTTGPGFGFNLDEDLVIAYAKNSISLDDYSLHFAEGEIEIHTNIEVNQNAIEELNLETDFVIEAGTYSVIEYLDQYGNEIVAIEI